MAKLGIEADCFIGHSIGELVAACASEVLSLEDALMVVAHRGQLMAQQPTGSMLSVGLSEQAVSQYLTDELSLAAVNGPQTCVLSGQTAAIESLAAELNDQNIPCTILRTSHAFHSDMMAGALPAFAQVLSRVELKAPTKPFISNVTGDWITESQATSVDYWLQQLRGTVRFHAGIETIIEDESVVLLEAGPGASLTTLAKMSDIAANSVIQSLPRYQDRGSDQSTMKLALGLLWAAGVKPDWQTHYQQDARHRVELPTYAFERQRFWLETHKTLNNNTQADVVLENQQQLPQQASADESLFSEGRIELNLKWRDISSEKQQQQLQQVMALKQQLETLCADLAQDADVDLAVSGLKLLKRQQSKTVSNDSTPSVQETVVTNNQRPDIATEYVAASNELEQSLVQTWEKALGFTPVGVNDNFFDLGGHSLIAATLVNQLRQNFEVEIDLRELLESPTVATVAKLVKTKQWLNEEAADDAEVDAELAESDGEEGEALFL